MIYHKERLTGIHPDLLRVVKRASEDAIFTVIEGVRPQARQDELYAQGRTTPGPIVTWVKTSNHVTGHAVDLGPMPLDWKNTAAFDALAKVMFAAAAELHIHIRWGANWDEDDVPREHGETDSPHFELVI
jgi:peptidoglycan L-alanyl-D-glutamate endopeptidase CwlK